MELISHRRKSLRTHNLDLQKSDEKLRCKAEASFDITITPGSPEEANSALMFKSAAYIRDRFVILIVSMLNCQPKQVIFYVK